MAVSAATTHAETYVGVSAGAGLGQRLKNGKGDENINYPNKPGAGELFPGTDLSKLYLQDSPTVGLKFGHWFDQVPYVGLELETFYNRPNFKRQNVTLSHPDLGTFTQDQLAADIDQYVFTINALYRYQGLKSKLRVTPYIGAGPALYLWNIRGTGLSGIEAGQPIETGVQGPAINETSVTVGANLKMGVEYALTEKWGLGIEYRFNWSPFHVDNFRSISNGSGNYHGHAMALTLNRYF